MNDLKKYAGLLNDIAPKGEFLAYINQDEAEMLKDNGALGLLTPQGIPSYEVLVLIKVVVELQEVQNHLVQAQVHQAAVEETLAVVVAVEEEVVKVIHPHLHLHQY